MDRPGVLHVPEGSEKERKMEDTGVEVIRGAPTTPAVNGWVTVKQKKRSEENKNSANRRM